MQNLSLGDNTWILTPTADVGPIPFHLRPCLLAGVRATVPGCVHTDLISAGILDDPYLGDNELKQFWIGSTDWTFSRTCELSPQLLACEHLDLAFDGLDTIATIELNGVVVGTSQTMHARHRFPIKSAAKPGANTLRVHFAAPRTHADRQRDVYGPMPVVGGTPGVQHPHNLIRKMACNFGWDWGPDVTTSGIFRAVRLEAWSGGRISGVRPLVTRADRDSAEVRVRVDVQGSGTVNVALLTPGGKPVAGTKTQGKKGQPVEWVFSVDRPALWWPVGHGGMADAEARPLYPVEVTLTGAAGEPLDRASCRVGLRTTELLTTPDVPAAHPISPAISPAVGDAISPAVGDARGERMELRISGKPVYCKGANWIPDDCFPHRVTRDRYERRIRQALDANMNMLRVWGGGLFESDEFYDLCDELGMMVWQDFPFACSTYPENADYKALVELEARDNVTRLASHPSLVVYNGGNENIVATYDWAAEFRKIRMEGKVPWGLGYWLDLLPKVLAELDPSRPYWPNSPYSGTMDRHPNANEFGNRHMWDVWHGEGQYRNYLGHFPRMATEFGYHAPPNYATLARAIAPEHRYWTSPQLLLHNKNYQDGQLQTTTRIGDDFTPPPPTLEAFDAWHYLAQTMQARALSMGIEWFRALHPWNSASLYWQFNDCWPVSSWSAVDGDGRAKPLLHASRRFFAPRLLTIKPARVTPGSQPIGDLCVYLHNDTDQEWTAPVSLREVTLLGDTLASTSHRVTIAPRSLARFDVPSNMTTRPSSFLVASTPDSHRAFWWFSPDKDYAYPEPRYNVSLDQTGPTRYRLEILAHTLLRDLTIQPDRLHPAATIDDAQLTLLPGDRASFHLHCPAPLSAEQLSKPPILFCANLFGKS